MSRLFVAVWPPSRVLDQVSALSRTGEGWRWTRPDQWHVTLRFLGEADEDEAGAALERVQVPAVEAAAGPAVQRLGRGVMMVPVSGLDDVAAAVTDATSAVGRPPETRPFRGHLTLARRRGKGRADLTLVGTPIVASFRVDEVHLVRSTTHPDGARYETVAVRTLGD